jgi:hypothetical protein
MIQKIVKPAIFILFMGFILLQACKKKDTDPPNLMLKGDTVVYQGLHTEYVDSGVLATDNVSDVEIITDTSSLNTDSIGTYYIKYIATDDEGNESVIERKLVVILTSESMEGEFIARDTISSGPNSEFNDGIYSYKVIISAKPDDENMIQLKNFGGFGENTQVDAQIDEDNTLRIHIQQFDGGTKTITGDGKVNYNAKKIHFDYELTYGPGGEKDVASMTLTRK